MGKKTYTIDGAKFTTLAEFAEEFSRVCLAGYQWKGNLDAFNDILYGGFGTPDEGFRLVWKNAALSKNNLGYEETVKWYKETLQRCHPSNIPLLRERKALAQQGRGQTLFEWIIDIIKNHHDIELALE